MKDVEAGKQPPTIAGMLPDRFLTTGMPSLLSAGIAFVPSWKTEMAKVTETFAKLGAFDHLAKLVGASPAVAGMAAQQNEMSATLARAIAPAVAPTFSTVSFATLAPWRTKMAKVIEAVAKLGMFGTLARDPGASSGLARIATQHKVMSTRLAEAIAPAVAPRLNAVTARDLATPGYERNWVRDIPPNPVPSILREVHAELAQANAAETARADAAEKRAGKAEARAERAERHTVISIWLNVGMFVLTISTLIVAMVA